MAEIQFLLEEQRRGDIRDFELSRGEKIRFMVPEYEPLLLRRPSCI